MRFLKTVLAAVAAVSLVANSAAAEAVTSVGSLAVRVDAGTIRVDGTALFSGERIELGTDPTGDANGRPGGYDVTAASVALLPSQKDLQFTLAVADQLPLVSGTPNIVYSWPLMINGKDTGLHLHAGSAGLYGLTPSATPVFSLLQEKDGSFFELAALQGSIGGGAVSWTVPMRQIGATHGSVVDVGSAAGGAVESTTGVAGAGYLYHHGDSVSVNAFKVPGEVSVGIAPAGTPDDHIVMSTRGGLKTGGAFSASLPVPTTAGTYRVGVRACSSDSECAVSFVDVSV